MKIYEFNAKDITGKVVPLEQYQGNILLIVNTATACGFTPQYNELEALYKKYQGQGFLVLDFPCNQFGQQAPGSEHEISNFCSLNFGVSFPQFSKVDVNGETAHPLFQYLQSEKGFAGFDPKHKLTPILENMLRKENPNFEKEASIKWNFTKFLVDRNGQVLQRFEPTSDISEIDKIIKSMLS